MLSTPGVSVQQLVGFPQTHEDFYTTVYTNPLKDCPYLTLAEAYSMQH